MLETWKTANIKTVVSKSNYKRITNDIYFRTVHVATLTLLKTNSCTFVKYTHIHI
jgi:hypothetical protein